MILERVTVIGSNLSVHDEYIKSYLQAPEIPLTTKIKIGLRYYITADLILQPDGLKNYLEMDSFKDLKKWYLNNLKEILLQYLSIFLDA